MRLIDIEPFETEKDVHSCQVRRWHTGDGYSKVTVTATKDIPTIDPSTLRPKGEWLNIGAGYDNGEEYPEWKCSVCGKEHLGATPRYCSDCGADMRGEA